MRSITIGFLSTAAVAIFCLPAASSTPPYYAIVTSKEIRIASAELPAFVAHKASRGFTVLIFDEGDWGGMGLTGDVAAEALRSFLQSTEALYNIDYLLIIGDPRTGTGPVPMKNLYPRTYGYLSTSPNGWNADCDSFVMTQDAVPTDLYYSDVDGNWDLDGDGLYGEFGDFDAPVGPTGDFGHGGVDRAYDFKIGRIPLYTANASQLAQGIADLDHILTKTMDYQNAPSASIGWRNSALIAAEGANRIFFGEALRDDIFLPALWNPVVRIYDAAVCYANPPANCVPINGIPEATTCSVANVFNEWTTTDPGAVAWLTHGGGQGAADIMNSAQAALLDDSKPVITFQASCYNSLPSAPNNLSFALLKNGAVGTVGGTGITHGPGGPIPAITDPSSAGGNAGMAYYFMQGLVQQDLSSGESLAKVRGDTDLYGRCWYWHNMVAFNLYGDPEVRLSAHAIDPIPALSPRALGLLTILLLGAGLWNFRRTRHSAKRA